MSDTIVYTYETGSIAVELPDRENALVVTEADDWEPVVDDFNNAYYLSPTQARAIAETLQEAAQAYEEWQDEQEGDEE
jgi:hypothetical protein